MNIKKVNKQILITETLLSRGETRARELGIGFTDYMRYLIVEDTKNIRENLELSSEEKLDLIQAIKESKSLSAEERGKRTLQSNEEIDLFFDELDKASGI